MIRRPRHRVPHAPPPGVAARGAGAVAILVSLVLALTPAAAFARSAVAARVTSGASQDNGPHVVVLGVSGLTWGDLSASRTPALWDLAGGSAVGSLVVRGVFQRTCGADGWLTIGAGARAVAPRLEQPDGDLQCAPMPPTRWDGTTWHVQGWQAIVAENADRYAPPFGVVVDSLAAQGQCSTAVGPGAALMLADANGEVAHYASRFDEVTSQLLSACAVTAIDLGEVAPAASSPVQAGEESGAQRIAADRRASLLELDRQVAAVRRMLPADATLMLVSTADETPDARLRVLMATGPAGGGETYTPGVLTTSSTRRDGLVQITDVTPMVLQAAEAPPVEPLVGTAPTSQPSNGDLTKRVAALVQLDQRAQVILRITFPINQAIVIVALVMYLVFGVVGTVIARRRRSEGIDPAVPLRLRRWLRIASLLLASIPLATYCTNLVPWWRLARGPETGLATTAMLGLALVIALLLAAAALTLPWLQRPFRAVGFIASVTVAVLAVDVVLGSQLQFATVLGLSPIAAGRFYGFGNVAFSVFATSAVFAAIGMSAPLVRAGRRRAAAALVLAFGVAVALVDGWPSAGADFGGMIALVAGFGFFAVIVATGRFSWRPVLLVALAGVAFAMAVAFADYLRPPQSRTHLGEFVASLLHGDAGSTIRRKLSASLSSFTFNAAAPAIPVLWAVLGWVVLRPARFGASSVEEFDEAVPTFRAGLLTGLLVAGLGALVNDSGVIVTATMLGVGVPLAVAAAAEAVPRAPEPPAAASPAAPPPLATGS